MQTWVYGLRKQKSFGCVFFLGEFDVGFSWFLFCTTPQNKVPPKKRTPPLILGVHETSASPAERRIGHGVRLLVERPGGHDAPGAKGRTAEVGCNRIPCAFRLEGGPCNFFSKGCVVFPHAASPNPLPNLGPCQAPVLREQAGG